ncbi:unnamed protein product [Soboliphyme baturini]|uniref:Intraflagellar transport protein 46 homolog n=1 Tax=Soboliphyme baturini TaxID=241478 RepID=A0A183ICX5_9BILA|nr:unnamed protein product [Soboliphyme baturini]
MTTVRMSMMSASVSRRPSLTLAVERVSRADKNPQKIDAFLRTIAANRQKKPSASVQYIKPMPSIESLMQEWPPEFEQLTNTVSLPSADLDVPLKNYIDIICALLDIPVYKSYIKSLHVLFSLYLEFKNSSYFRKMKMDKFSPTASAEGKQELVDSGQFDTLIL